MPEICRFYGIIIRIHIRDHAPPHFHALYGEHEALIEINSLATLHGHFPPRASRLVLEWASMHQDEIMEAWERAQRAEPPGSIAPLE